MDHLSFYRSPFVCPLYVIVNTRFQDPWFYQSIEFFFAKMTNKFVEILEVQRINKSQGFMKEIVNGGDGVITCYDRII